MSFTLSTLPLTMLALYLAYRAKWNLLPVAMFMSIFQAASILNIGDSVGIGISYLLLGMALVSSYLLGRKSQTAPSKGNRAAGLLLLLFVLYATLMGFVGPVLFEGTLFSNPKMGSNVPLRWETGHLNQLAYLFLGVAFFFVISRRTSSEELKQSVDWYIAGNAFASLIGIYQFICLNTGLPFPSEFLHTNPVYGIFEAYDISGFARTNSTFTEASAAAGSLTPALGILFWRLLDKPNWKDGALAGLIFVGLFLTISTTGFVSFGFLLCISIVVFLSKWRISAKARATKLVFGGLFCCLAIGTVAIPAIRNLGMDLLDVVIFSKTSTGSYVERTQWNTDALQTASDTLWLGAGFGVCRASSLLPTLLGNVGVPGVSLFVLFLSQVFRAAWRTTRGAAALQGELIFASAVALFGLLVAGPEITAPPIWLFFGGAVTAFPVLAKSRRFRRTSVLEANNSSASFAM